MPPSRSPDVDVVLYGATGYTGRLIARELDALGVDFLLAGRDTRKLEALAGTLPSRPETLTVPVNDTQGLEALSARARVVLSAAGPFAALGPPVMRAAIKSGAHFADITGEQEFLRWAHAQDAASKEAGVTVVNALGFDVVPSDLAAILASRGLARIDRLDIGIASTGGLSGGTRRSMAGAAGKGWWFENGHYRPAPPGRFTRAFRFPEPLGERESVFIPWGDVVTAPRSTGARRVRTFFTMRPSRARGMHLAWPLLDLALRAPWYRKRLEAKAAHAPEGPSPEERAEARFAIVAEATAPDGRVQRGIVTGRDPYGLTAASAALAATRLARGEVARTGVLTPSQAFDLEAHAKALSRFGLAWRTESG